MKGDFSRNSFDPTKHYRGVRMQQGRVQIDADWNEQIDITDYRDRLFTEDFLGDSVGPSTGAGFAIGVTANQQDLTIGLGRYYVNGLLVENSSSLYFTQQTDYPQAVLPNEEGVYLTYLEVWQRSLSIADDADIAESALAGADTATRLYNVAQVKLMPALNIDNNSLTYNALFNAKATIDSDAYNNMQNWNAITNRLPASITAAQLLPNVTTIKSTTTYHIKIHQGGNSGEATYKTSIDNPLVEMTIAAINDHDITLAQAPSGQTPFAVNQWLELTTPLRDASKLPGDMTQITKIIGSDASGLTLSLSGVIGKDITITNAAVARRWQNNAIIVDSAQYSLEAGLAINFLGNSFESGSYWTIATNATSNTINWPKKNNQYTALPPNFITVSQLTPIVATTSTLQNQLYRIEIHQGGNAGTASFKWSRDNASVSSKISFISGNNITLATSPQDGVNGFILNQWLELTTPARELIGKPGNMVQITALNSTTLTVTGNIDSDITVANNAIATRWDTAVTGSAGVVQTIITSKPLPIENGLSISFSGSDFQTGDYWLIPARAAINNQGSHIEWPLDANGKFLAQLPNGIQRSYAPLAIVQCSGGKWLFQSDARTIAIPLSELNIKVIGADPCAPADTIHVDCDGQVGISTDTPKAKLDVQTNAGMISQDAIHATAAEGYAADFINSSATNATVRVINNGSGNGINTTTVNGYAEYLTNNSSSYATLSAINLNADGSYAAVVENTSSHSPTLYVENKGNNQAGEFVNHSTQPALNVINKGDGAAAIFSSSCSSDEHATLQIWQTGTGNGEGIRVNAQNGGAVWMWNEGAAPTLYMHNSGSGDGIQALTGAGYTGHFTNYSSTNPTLYAINCGDPNNAGACHVAASFNNNSTTQPTLFAQNNGDHQAARLINSSNTQVTLAVSNNGGCNAAVLTNNGTNEPTLWVENLNSDGNYAAVIENTSSQLPTLRVYNKGNHIAGELLNSSAMHPTLYIQNSASGGQALQANGNAAISGSLTIGNTNSGSFSLTPVANKVPVADQSGHINAGWLPSGSFVSVDQLRNSVFTNLIDAGTVNHIKLNPNPAYTTLESGTQIQFTATITNTSTAVDVQINGGQIFPVEVAPGKPVQPSDIIIGGKYYMMFGGAAWVLINPSSNPKHPVAKTSLAKDFIVSSYSTPDSAIQYDTVSDPYGIFSTNHYTATIPLAGTWRITTGNIATGGGAYIDYLYVKKNGGIINTLWLGTGTGLGFSMSGAIELDLGIGDTIQISVLNNGIIPLTIVGGMSGDMKNGSYFQLSYIGPSTAVPVPSSY